MFDIGFTELLVLALVALLVLGPERLPRAARMAGLWVRRAKASWYSVKAELERELADEELKRSLKDAARELHEAGDALRDGLRPPVSGGRADRTDAATPARDDRDDDKPGAGTP
ncbi:Sec-independent protein translocase protein TatB [Rehaibacterium terrae]|jgi:sec-independent protein translocase protein TatB|uniref:Sec-independent protein translocase protein TatB n=1 Tax=Rehaibacterium terrae TaxID=1341696 RepID=A0A7W7V6N7_9GAMM|nr:sec-independent protein translocase protein TatB [Rehaibacterium terrae]